MWYDAASGLDLSEEREECEGWDEMERESQVSVFVLLYCFTAGVSICAFVLVKQYKVQIPTPDRKGGAAIA